VNTNAIAERLDDAVEHIRSVFAVPGLALAVTDRDGLLLERTYGHADVGAGRPVTSETLFEIGSIGKSFTACCVLQLVEEGRLDLHLPVTAYLPWFEVRSPFDEPITLHHLLTHTAGITRGGDSSSNSLFDVWSLRSTEVTVPPGSVFWYSNVGYRVIGAVLEAIEGRPYAEILRERVMDRVGMAGSEPSIRTAMRERLANGYGPWPDDRPALPSGPMVPAVWFETATADGSVAASARDLAAYLRMLMKRGDAPNGRVLTEESFALLSGRMVKRDDEWYGYGLATEEAGGVTWLGHGGGMVGYESMMDSDVEAGLGAVVLINGVDWGSYISDLARYAVGLVRASRAGEPLSAPPPTPSLTRVMDRDAYVGTYTASDGSRLEMTARGDGLAVAIDGGEALDAFPTPGASALRLIVPNSDLDTHAVIIDRNEAGLVTSASHGPRFFVPGDAAPQEVVNEAWRALEGRFESYNPWMPTFRVVQRAGRLMLCERSGMEFALAQIDGTTFALEDPALPERLRFDAIVDGKALRANASGCDYYRSFEP
jgi:CubicO group peptidase (beta-lactamase class C family)